MSKRNVETRTIEITEFAWLKIHSWGQALDEVCFIAYGPKNRIVDAIRMRNISSSPRNFFDYSKSDISEARKKIKEFGFKIICMGHSHPNRNHMRHPSKSDWQCLPKKSLQIIVFPIELKISGWVFASSYKRTIENRLIVKIVESA